MTPITVNWTSATSPQNTPLTSKFPSTPNFLVQLFGFENGFAVINVYNEDIWTLHMSLLHHLKTIYKDKQPLPIEKIHPGMNIVADTGDGWFIRAKVLSIEGGRVIIDDLDEARKLSVLPYDVYDFGASSFGGLKVPFRMQNVSLSLNLLSHLTSEQAQALKQKTRLDGIYLCSLIDSNLDPPVVQMVDRKGRDLRQVILKEIGGVLVGANVLPDPLSTRPEVTVTFYDQNATIWYQLGNEKMLDAISEMHEEKITENNLESLKLGVGDELKEIMCSVKSDGEWYRVKVVKVLDHEQVLVRFLDFGNTEKVKISDLLASRKVNEELLVIPELAMKGKLRLFEKVDLDVMEIFMNSTRHTNLILVKTENQVPIVDFMIDVDGFPDQKSLVDVLLELNAGTLLFS